MAKKQLVEIEVTIPLGGKISIEAKGFKGAACLKETKFLEDALGKVESRDMKPEAGQKVTVPDVARIKD